MLHNSSFENSSANICSVLLRSDDLRSSLLSFVRSAQLCSALFSSAQLSSAQLSSAQLSSVLFSSDQLCSIQLCSAQATSSDLSWAGIKTAVVDDTDGILYPLDPKLCRRLKSGVKWELFIDVEYYCAQMCGTNKQVYEINRLYRIEY